MPTDLKPLVALGTHLKEGVLVSKALPDTRHICKHIYTHAHAYMFVRAHTQTHMHIR